MADQIYLDEPYLSIKGFVSDIKLRDDILIGLPKFHFVDPDGREWRIRQNRLRILRVGGYRWRIECWTDSRWSLRAFAPTRKLAQDRMTRLWASESTPKALAPTK